MTSGPHSVRWDLLGPRPLLQLPAAAAALLPPPGAGSSVEEIPFVDAVFGEGGEAREVAVVVFVRNFA